LRGWEGGSAKAVTRSSRDRTPITLAPSPGMSSWQHLGVAGTPSATRAWAANFAMSQSPPSYSPVRRALQGSPSSQRSDEGDDRPVDTSVADAIVADTAPPRGNGVAGGTDDAMEGDDDDDEDDDQPEDRGTAGAVRTAGAVAALAGHAPGVQVLTGVPGIAQESEEEGESEEGEAEGADCNEAKEQQSGDHTLADATSAMPDSCLEPGPLKQEKDVEADDEDAESEEEAADGVTDQSALDAEPAPESCREQQQSIVDGTAAMPPDVTTAQQIVAVPCTDSADAWGSTLPPEATDEWTVAGDVCSLQVGVGVMKLPRSVYDRLYGYQRKGVVWMWNLYHKGFGGILADEMGLGKTVQTAAFLACLKFTEQGSHFLVVVNVTLLEQWRRELSTWTKDTGLAVHVMHGTPQERRAALRGMMIKGGVMLASYDGIRNGISCLRTAGLVNTAAIMPKKRKRQTNRGCRDDDSPSEEEEPLPPMPPNPGAEDANAPWDVVIVDEAHQLKNPSCVSGRALRKVTSRSRFLLTGTPLQNKLSDLWALMDFAQPGLLGNHATFERSFSEQIAKGSKRNATRFAVELKDHLARELKRLTAPHFLRRLKCEVIAAPATAAAERDVPRELPPKMDVVLWLNLTPAQQELYSLYLGSDTVRRATGQSRCGMEALKAIALLKKLCNHPLLCLPAEEFNQWRSQTVTPAAGTGPCLPGGGGEELPVPAGGASETQDEDIATQPAPECQHVLPRLRALVPSSVQGAALLSCKLRVLSVLLPQLQRRGHRCLIFSQSTRMLDLIQACVLRALGLKFLRIDGTIEAKDRDLKIAKFQQPDSRYFCICLSIQVGGTGLTITGADRVILVDPAWNPSMDAQAIDRVHRIGQLREVVVYRLIGAGAIEDKMFRLQVFKRGLSKTYLEQEQQIRFFTHKELKQLFEPPSSSTSTQSLMAEQIGTEALEHEELLRVVAGDIGSTDDPQALPFWQSSDVLGFSDYQRLFMFLEQANKAEEEAVQKAKALTARLKSEEYVTNQVVDGKWRAGFRDGQSKENVSPQQAGAEVLPLQDVES